MYIRILPILFLLASLTAAQDAREQHVAWLAEHLKSDLAGFGAMVGDARVVFLGEASHGDGSTFTKKVELCRYLHQKLGFSVIAFESGMYECHKAWLEIQSGRAPRAAATDAIFPVWTRSAQVAPLWEYIGKQSRTENRLELAGFDFQPSGVHTKKSLLGELTAAVQVNAKQLLDAPMFKEFSHPYALIKANKFRELRGLKKPARDAFYESTDRIAAAIETKEPFLAQMARSQSTFFRFMWNMDMSRPDPKVFNLREEQGAANLLWLLNQRYKGRKIIVWGATSHLSRNRQQIETNNAPNMIPVGHHVAKALGAQAFMLGFVTHHGKTGIARAGARVRTIDAAPRGSFADLLGATPHDSGFLDLRATRWLQEKRVARPMGHGPMKADWSKIVDAFCFIREMRASTLAEPGKPTPESRPGR